MNKNLPKLIILSDLWGHTDLTWSEKLIPYFNIHHYDSRELANLPIHLNSEKEIHQYFIDFGINRAVQNILSIEKDPIQILGFSIGGVIAWKAIASGLNAHRLICISSTRLRYQTQKLNIPTTLYFGKEDPHTPSLNWFAKFQIIPHILPNQNHQVYLNQRFLKLLLHHIIDQEV